MLDLKNPEIKFAIDAVRSASLLVKTVQSEMVTQALTKDDRSPVTVADFAAQALVGHLLAKTYPNDPLIGEENSSALREPAESETLRRITAFIARFAAGATPALVCDWIDRGSADSAERYWTLDPIDGTKGFLRGDQYAVALALVYDQQVQVGVLGCPELSLDGIEGVLLAAARGQGTWLASLDEGAGFHQVQVSQQVDPSGARLL